MSGFDNYADLQGSVSTWLGRSDLAANIPDFITLFEASANRSIIARAMLTTVSLTTVQGVANLPSDYIGADQVEWKGDPTANLEYIDPAIFNMWFPTFPTAAGTPGTPEFYTIQVNTISIVPFDDTSPTLLTYYQKIPPLASNTTNWLLQDWPDAYLFGTLVEANAFIMDATKGELWLARRDQAFNEITEIENRFRGPAAIHSTGPIV